MHFTYAAEPKGNDLQQGDLLKRSPALDDVINKYHPYYSGKRDYTHFLVLTQTCDLVRRNDKSCSCPYVTLGAVRPLHVALEREAARHQGSPLLQRAGAVSTRSRNPMEAFAARLLNNNHPEYFYLHEEPQIGLYSSCAFLRLSIAIKADDHYKTCLDSRVATLNAEFRPKLGWLVGNIFSRVGTEDWEEARLKKHLQEVLDENMVWLEEEKIKATKLTKEEIEKLSPEEVIKKVEAAEIVKRKDKVIAAILDELKSGNFIKAQDIDAMKKQLGQATTVATLLK